MVVVVVVVPTVVVEAAVEEGLLVRVVEVEVDVQASKQVPHGLSATVQHVPFESKLLAPMQQKPVLFLCSGKQQTLNASVVLFP